MSAFGRCHFDAPVIAPPRPPGARRILSGLSHRQQFGRTIRDRGLSNFSKLTTYQDYSGDFAFSSVACALKTRPPRSSRQFALVTKVVLS